MSRFGSAQVLPASNTFEIRASEVAAPELGDLLECADETFAISIEPLLDVEGLTWTCAAEPEA